MTGRRHFGSVRKLRSGRYQASYWHEGIRHIAPQTFAAKADALAYLSVTETNLLRGEWIDPEAGRETFGAYGKRWLSQRPDLRPSTRELYEGLWRKWLEPVFSDVTLAAMTPERWRAWYVEQMAQHPGSTRPGKAYRLARSILSTAVEDGRIKTNPCRVKGAGRNPPPNARSRCRTRSRGSRRRSTRGIGRWCCSAPIARSASASSQGCAASGSTSFMGR